MAALTEPEARTRLSSMVASSEEPTLSPSELDDLIRIARVHDADGNPPDAYAYWRASTAYNSGDRVAPTRRNGHVYEVASTTGDRKTSASEPAWPVAAGATVTDGNVTWREVGLAPWLGRWSLRRAAHEGWRRKAGKAAGNYKFSAAGGGERPRDEVFKRCLEMARLYAPLRSGRIGTGSLP